MKYKAGDKVRIVSERTSFGWNEKMDKWLDKVMTIRSETSGLYRMVEDQYDKHNGSEYIGWCWWEEMISGLASEIEEKEEFFVGDWVIVVDNGKNYSCYYEWFINYRINKGIKCRYSGGLVEPRSIGRIVASAPHERDGVMLHAIDVDNRIYLIGESGLARIKANIGDSVIITGSDYCYSRYDDWFTKNKVPFCSFHGGKEPSNKAKGIIVAIAPHSAEQYNKILYLVDTFTGSFLMGENGFEKRTMYYKDYNIGYDLNEASFKREYECIWTETNETNPDKLLCIEDDVSEFSHARYLTAGKIYEFDGHKVNYDCGSCANFENRKDWIKSDPNLSKKLVKLTKRKAKIGDIIYYEKTVDQIKRNPVFKLDVTNLIEVENVPIRIYFCNESFELEEKDYYVLDFEYKYELLSDMELVNRLCYHTKCTADDCFLTPYPCYDKDVVKDYCLRPDILSELARIDRKEFKRALKI